MIPADGPDPIKEYGILLGELEKYNPELLDKARVLAISKSDILDSARMDEIEAVLPDDRARTCSVSSVTGMGLVWLKDMLWEAMNKQAREKERRSFEEEHDPGMLGVPSGDLLGGEE